MTRKTERVLPVIFGGHERPIMTRATIIETPGRTSVSLVFESPDAEYVGGFLTSDAPMAISIAGIPVTPRSTPTKEQN